MTDEIVNGTPRRVRGQQVELKPDVMGFIFRLPDPYNSVKLVRTLGACLMPFEVDADREELMLSVLLQGAEVYDWNPFQPAAQSRVESLLKLVFELPDYQLT